MARQHSFKQFRRIGLFELLQLFKLQRLRRRRRRLICYFYKAERPISATIAPRFDRSSFRYKRRKNMPKPLNTVETFEPGTKKEAEEMVQKFKADGFPML